MSPVSTEATSFDGLFGGYRQEESYIVPEADKELVKQLNDFIDESQKQKQTQEQEWAVHLCYLKGEVVARHRSSGELVRLGIEAEKRLQSRNNMLRPISRSLVGKLSKMIPTCTTIPATSDWGEMAAAKVGDAFFAYLRRKEDLDVKYLSLMGYMPWAGNAFMEQCWDPCAGQKIAFCDTCDYYTYDTEAIGSPCPQCTAQRQQEIAIQQSEHEAMLAEATVAATEQALQQDPTAETVMPEELGELPPPPMQQTGPLGADQEPPALIEAYEGDVRLEVRDPRDVFVPVGCEHIKNATRAVTRDVVEVTEARRRFPQFAPYIHAEQGLFNDRSLKWRYGLSAGGGTVHTLNDHVIIWTAHERPTEEYPKGRLIRKVNDMIVEEEEHPLWYLDRVPLYHFGFDVNEGEFWREPYLTHAWHRQKELDNLESKLRQHVELLLAQKWLIANTSRVAADEITADTGQIIEYNAAAPPPKPMEVPQLPQPLWQRKADLVQDMRMQASVTEQEQGLTTADPNGRAMAIINAEADQATGPITVRNHNEWREMHRGALLTVQRKYHRQRKFTVAGPDGLQTYSFDNVDLTTPRDVQIEEQDGLSRNPAIRFNEVLQLAQVGNGALFMDMRTGMFDKKAFARMAKLKFSDTGYDFEAFNRAAAQSIPYYLAQGLAFQPEEFDDPAIFAEELLGWLQGPGRQGDPNIKNQVKQIWMYYQQWLSMQQMGQPGMPPAMASQPGGMSAPGGTPNNPGSLGTDVGSQAAQQVKQADQTGESLSRQGLEHES